MEQMTLSWDKVAKKIVCLVWWSLLWGCLLIVGKSQAWAQGHGFPFEGPYIQAAPSIQALVMTDTEVVYAGSFGMGIFRSEDQGLTWHSVNEGLGDHYVLCLAVDEQNRVYAGTIRGGVFRTVRGGTQWESISQGLKRVEVKSLLAHNKTIYAGTGRGVYRWQENAHEWGTVAKGLDQILVSSMVMVGDHTLMVGTSGKGLFQLDTRTQSSTDWTPMGETFVDPKERLTHRFIRIVAVGKDLQMYAGTQDGGIFTSVDGGNSWKPVGRSLPNDSIRGIVPTGLGLFVATGRGIYKSIDGQSKWLPMNDGLTELSVQVLIAASPNTLFAGTSVGAFRSDDGGGQWVNVSKGMGMQASAPHPYF